MARAEKRISLYTGNDDHIVLDLTIPFTVMRDDGPVTLRFVGGLLGHWSVWTQSAVKLLDRIHAAVAAGAVISEERRVGKGCVRSCSYRGSRCHYTKNKVD